MGVTSTVLAFSIPCMRNCFIGHTPLIGFSCLDHGNLTRIFQSDATLLYAGEDHFLLCSPDRRRSGLLMRSYVGVIRVGGNFL